MYRPLPLFTESHAALLRNFLSSPQRPNGTLTYPQLAGFLFSIANAPQLIPPSDWIPLVFNDQDAGFEIEAEPVLQAMMALYNDCGQDRASESASLPPGCEVRSEPMDNFDADAPLGQWAQGFLTGDIYLEDVWNQFTSDELDRELGCVVMVLTFFASRSLAEAYHKEGKSQTSLEQLAETVVRVFPHAMTEYAHLGRSMFQARCETGDLREEPPRHQKVRRNDPCGCGSGKKFKKCCGAR